MNHKAGSLLKCRGRQAPAAPWCWGLPAGTLTVMRSPEVHTLPLALRSLQSPVDTAWGAWVTGSAAGPLAVLFRLSSRQLVSGVTAGAFKSFANQDP
jgi:ABC-type glycerol-3-phosphate transport system permease component